MTNQNPLISVIVPVYNAEKTLHRCVDSICTQTHKNLEIILVDDGSTDKSSSICDEYAAKDVRVRVIHKENGGLSFARNSGLDSCRGEYITFVDSDDYILPQMYESMLAALTEKKVDICVCQWQYEKADGKQVVSPAKIESAVYGYKSAAEFAEFLYKAGPYENGVVVSVWNKLYCRDVFESLRFAGRYAEDDEICARIYSQPYRVFVMDGQYYVYCENHVSLTHIPFSGNRLFFLNVLERRCEQFADNSYIVERTRRLYCEMYIEYYFKATDAGIAMPEACVFDSMLERLVKTGNCSLKCLVRMLLFRFSPQLYRILLNR